MGQLKSGPAAHSITSCTGYPHSRPKTIAAPSCAWGSILYGFVMFHASAWAWLKSYAICR